ncbi:hypothetical protein CHS0354_010615 [Potamilus streckersoni]|uniref:Uncharacterized protein n=1 Tax=Potamilus streckersoni TaxID=2493646 RepID=A0AAE0SG04_9BIVA|nr:hypothetical protein CHS0354_010615 [Potamilus streckersoni]
MEMLSPIYNELWKTLKCPEISTQSLFITVTKEGKHLTAETMDSSVRKSISERQPLHRPQNKQMVNAEHKLRWNGNITRSSGVVNTILQVNVRAKGKEDANAKTGSNTSQNG